MVKYLAVSRKKPIFAENFLRTDPMIINHCLRLLLIISAFLATSQVSAQETHCKDTAEHRRLKQAMWELCNQDSTELVYDACMAFLNHAKADNDMVEANTAWVCGVMYTLGRMNIASAYHIVEGMKNDIEQSKYPKDALYFISNMMGHVYNTCGNVSGAEAEFLKSAELIKGTRFEKNGLPFIYLALAHVHLNNSLSRTLYWLDVTEKELKNDEGSWNYYRCLADVYAIRAITRFKQKNYPDFRRCLAKMEEAESKNPIPSGDLFAPYARVYRMLDEGEIGKALEAADALPNLKERYLMKCDIYRFIGDNEKAFMTQRELMHMRDSITGVMIMENIQRQEEEMGLLMKQQKMGRIMNYILAGGVLLAILAIVLLHRNLIIRRKFSKRLIDKNNELRAAYKQVAAADEMKTEFMRNVSHEIRTPLNIINGFSQVLSDQGPELEEPERNVISRTIGRSTRQITSLINKMLALANQSTKDLLSQVEETDGLEVCKKAIINMPDVDPQKVKVVFEDKTGGEATLYTNGDSLQQMLDNLLENAVKFTEEGQITLRIAKDEPDQKNMLFTVEDTGCGIPKDRIANIFDRWVKIDEFKEGLGLGLAYCRETAQKLGGTLTLDKTSEAGTAFTLSLPIETKKQDKK